MKKVLVLGFTVLTVALLSACGGPKELQLLWWSDGTEGQVMQELLDQYEEETGVIIELVEIPYGDYETRLRTMIRGDEAPALARVTEGHLNNFKDMILPLDDTITASNFTNLFYNDNDEVIGLPMDITANGLFVNLDILDAHNVNYPSIGESWTWDEFEDEMDKLRGQSGVSNPGVFDPQAHRFFPMVYQHGVTIWDTPYTSSNLTSDGAVKALTRLADYYSNGFIDDSVFAGSNAAGLFRTGAYGFHMSGNWNVSAYQDLDFNWTVVPMPTDSGDRATILGGKSLAAFEGSGLEDEALDFIAWMAEAEQHDHFTGGVPYLTPRLGAEVSYGDFQEPYAVFLDEIAATDARFVQDWLDQVMITGMYPVINQAIEDAAQGIKTPLEVLTELEAELKSMAD